MTGINSMRATVRLCATAVRMTSGFCLLLFTPALFPQLALAQQSSITLTEALRLAERVQPRVVQARGNVRDAGAQVRSAYGAFLPTVRASSSGAQSFSEGISRTDPITGEIISGSTTSTSVSMGLSANVDLFTGFRRRADLRAARAAEDAADADLVDARYQQALTTTNQFFDALAAAQLLTVREASVRRAEEQLKVSVAKLRSGSATRSDSLRSLVELGNARLQLIDTQTQLASAEANLARLIGAEGRVSATDDSSFYQVLEDVDTAAVRQEAGARSPQVQSASANSSAARAALSAARSGYWPTLNLSAQTNWNGSKSSDYDLFNQRQIGLFLNWNLFNGFTREANIVNRESAFDVAEATAQETQRQVNASLTTRLAELDAAKARIAITQTSVEAAREDLRVQQERYRLGAATIVEVLTSQENLTGAEVDAVRARYDYLRAKAQIEALIGRSL